MVTNVIWEQDFLDKHIVVVNDATSFDEMIKKGIETYTVRLGGARGGVRRGLVTHGNTLVITNNLGFQEMTSSIKANGKHGAKKDDNWIPIKVGAIIQSNDTSNSARMCANGGKIQVAIKKEGETLNIYHLNGKEIQGETTLTGQQVGERHSILRTALGDTDPVKGHYTDLNKIVGLIDGFQAGGL